MIIYRTTGPCPDFLAGAPSLCSRIVEGGCLWGICDPILFSPPEAGWVEVPCGRAALVGSPQDPPLARHIDGMPLNVARDRAGHGWAVPCILNQGGERSFVAAIGADWLPSLSAEQSRLYEVAKAARADLMRCADLPDDGLDAAVAARWCAELICAANYIDAGTLLALRLLDEALILSALMEASCRGPTP